MQERHGLHVVRPDRVASYAPRTDVTSRQNAIDFLNTISKGLGAEYTMSSAHARELPSDHYVVRVGKWLRSAGVPAGPTETEIIPNRRNPSETISYQHDALDVYLLNEHDLDYAVRYVEYERPDGSQGYVLTMQEIGYNEGMVLGPMVARKRAEPGQDGSWREYALPDDLEGHGLFNWLAHTVENVHAYTFFLHGSGSNSPSPDGTPLPVPQAA